MTWFCKRLDGVCERLGSLASIGDGEPSPPDSGGALTISAPVGIHGANWSEDVTTIQDALNRVSAAQGGASPPLEVDGKCGPKTREAIQVFQLKHFGWKGADGLIEPGKQTLAKLNEILGYPTSPGAAGTSSRVGAAEDLIAANVIQLAMHYVLAAQANMLAASPFLDSKAQSVDEPFPTFGREERMHLLNKHFGLDYFPQKRQVFDRILQKYDRMRQVFQRPGGLWGPAIFERDPFRDRKHHAYTYGGGYFMPGQTQYEKYQKVRLDSVYLCKLFLEKVSNRSLQAFIVVHELAHFVARFSEVIDFAYNREDNGAKVKALSPELKVLNAENYANFAHEAKTGMEPPG